MYIAKHYVKAIGRMYAPGEELPEDLSKDTVEWLIKAGAVYGSAPALSDTPAPEEEPEAPEEELEEDEDNIPEIDVMAGIVQDEEPVAPKRKSQRGGKSK